MEKQTKAVGHGLFIFTAAVVQSIGGYAGKCYWRMTLSLAVGFPKTDSSNVKRPRPTALKDYMHRLGRVGRFTPNPALPKDQPLRGSWHNEFLLSRNRVQLGAYGWTSNGYNDPQNIASSHNNLCLYLSAVHLTCSTKAFVLWLQTVGSVATNGL